MTYRNAIRYLNSFYDYEKHPSSKIGFFNLDRIKTLTNLLRNPQNDYPAIHITGTKGKGSVASILSHILAESGFDVGLYTSPHIIGLRERLKINNLDIEKKELADLVSELKVRIKKLGPSFRPSFFEIYTLLAFNYFKRKRVDFGIFEVGMGGRFDATNVIQPLVSGITSISYDHTEELGKQLTNIAREKAGIIKKGVDCISAPQPKGALKVIKDKCKGLDSRLFVVGKDITYRSLSYSKKRETFDIKGILDKYEGLRLTLLGEHQLINCAVSIGIAEILILKGYDIPKSLLFKGIAKTKWPGRCELISEKPVVILDSAHNRASASAIEAVIRRNFNYNKLILILGIAYDKDIKGILNELSPLADKIILTRADSLRAAKPEYIKKFLKNRDVIVSPDIRQAYNISKDLAGVSDIILVTGSIYLVGAFKRLTEIK